MYNSCRHDPIIRFPQHIITSQPTCYNCGNLDLLSQSLQYEVFVAWHWWKWNISETNTLYSPLRRGHLRRHQKWTPMMNMHFEAYVLLIIFISELNEFLSGGRTSEAQLKVANEYKIVGLRITLFKIKCWFKSESRPFSIEIVFT